MAHWQFALTAGMAVLAISSSSTAHHSVASEYDVNSRGRIQGVVSEAWFKNPHVRFYITVTEADGKEVTWDTHGHNPATLVKTGWTKDVIQVGEQVTIMGDSTRDGSPRLFIRTIELSNGKTLVSAPGADNRLAAGDRN
jgi:hypothetical protein